MHRQDEIGVDPVQDRAGSTQLTHHEPGNVAGLDLAEHEIGHPHEDALEGCLGFAPGRLSDRSPPAPAPHTLDPAPDHFRAGEPQALLAAEMIGDGGNVGVRRSRDLPRRRGFEPLGPEQPDARHQQRSARLVASLRGIWFGFGTLAHGAFRNVICQNLNAIPNVNQSIDLVFVRSRPTCCRKGYTAGQRWSIAGSIGCWR
jgi:hypothetical protein